MPFRYRRSGLGIRWRDRSPVEDDAMKTPDEPTTAMTPPTVGANNGVPQSVALSRNGPPPSKDEFEVMNRRRLALIDKEYDGGGLTDQETTELAQFTTAVSRYLDALSPTTEEIINHLKGRARKAGLSLDEFDQ
jgi:hypothetical protein